MPGATQLVARNKPSRESGPDGRARPMKPTHDRTSTDAPPAENDSAERGPFTPGVHTRPTGTTYVRCPECRTANDGREACVNCGAALPEAASA